MIYSLTGTIHQHIADTTVIDVHGIGYWVHRTPAAKNAWPLHSTQTITVHYHVREDAHTLYGFESSEERRAFTMLLSVSGIGPKVALGIIANIRIADLVHAIQTGNIMLITQVPGIGKKTAERMIIDLKEKCLEIAPPSTSNTPSPPASPSTDTQPDTDDIVMALRQLGYQKDEIKRVFMAHAPKLAQMDTIEDQIKILLKYL
jgi:Holliday junction DNA helicase RuvA